MEDLGYRVLTAQNGPEALSIERAVSRSTDLVMPHISGAKLGSGYSARMPRAAAAGLANVPQSCARFSRGVPN
jgi:CheY-like chemotaxis protein